MSAPLFDELATPSLDQAKATYSQRGGEYGDTWREKNPLALKAVMAKFGLPIPSEDVLSAMIAAALVDIKYSRLLGGYKEDSLIDGIAYTALLVGAVKRVEEEAQPAKQPVDVDAAWMATKQEGIDYMVKQADKAVATLKQDAKRGEPVLDPGLTYFQHRDVSGGSTCQCDICEVYRVNNP